MDYLSFIVLALISFFSSIVGTIMGMAMLILPPTMIFFGIPVHIAVATSRFSLVGLNIGNITKFSVHGKMHFKYALPFAVSGIIGALISASSLIRISDKILKITIGILMIVVSLAILLENLIVLKKKISKITFRHHLMSIFSGLLIGAYMGIIGGGGATIVIFLLMLIYGIGSHEALANQKAITLPIALVAAAVFIYQGLIDYKLGIPLLLINIIGGWVGATLVLKFSNIWLKRLLTPIIITMGIKLIFF
ncbi:MAG: sulfite exporter TauE/SafE family protein [Nanoarchaeota archaeon]